MGQKQHNDPLIYRAYGTLKGTYNPSLADPTQGTIITDDGEQFEAILMGEVAELFKDSTEQSEQLKQQCLWKCNFRTRPVTVQLKKAEITEKNCKHSFRTDRFMVDGQLLRVNKTTVSVLIKPNERDSEPVTLLLNGKFEEDSSYPFWRFKLHRKGRTFQIVWVKKLPAPEEKPFLTKRKRAKQIAHEKHQLLQRTQKLNARLAQQAAQEQAKAAKKAKKEQARLAKLAKSQGQRKPRKILPDPRRVDPPTTPTQTPNPDTVKKITAQNPSKIVSLIKKKKDEEN